MKKLCSLICFSLFIFLSAQAQVFSLVKNINPGNGNAIYNGASYYTQLNGLLYFTADDGATGKELWKTDGTAAGTQMVKDIYAGPIGCDPLAMITVGNLIYFTARTEINGFELWKSDGTTAGTVLLKDIEPVNN